MDCVPSDGRNDPNESFKKIKDFLSARKDILSFASRKFLDISLHKLYPYVYSIVI